MLQMHVLHFCAQTESGIPWRCGLREPPGGLPAGTLRCRPSALEHGHTIKSHVTLAILHQELKIHTSYIPEAMHRRIMSSQIMGISGVMPAFVKVPIRQLECDAWSIKDHAIGELSITFFENFAMSRVGSTVMVEQKFQQKNSSTTPSILWCHSQLSAMTMSKTTMSLLLSVSVESTVHCQLTQ